MRRAGFFMVPPVLNLSAIHERNLAGVDTRDTLITALNLASLDIRLTNIFARAEKLCRFRWIRFTSSLSSWEIRVANHLPDSLGARTVSFLWVLVLPCLNIHTSKMIIVHCGCIIILHHHD